MISTEDVHRLLDADGPGSTLVMVEGRPVVCRGDDEAAGLPVITRAALLAKGGERLYHAQGVKEIAARLEAMVRVLGG